MPEEIEIFDLTVASDMNQMERVVELTETVVAKTKLTALDQGNVTMCVSEMVTNAILHGNKEDTEKQVTIRFEVSSGECRVTVRDEGGGFKPDGLSDPTSPENLARESGRGIFLMREMMDEVSFNFNHCGTEVIILKKVP